MRGPNPPRRTANSEPSELTCCDEAGHEALLGDLEDDALVDPDIRRLIDRARRLLLPSPAPVPWWAR